MTEETDFVKGLLQRCEELNVNENIESKFPIGKEFYFLGKKVWVTGLLKHRLNNFKSGTEDSRISLSYWSKDEILQRLNMDYKTACRLLLVK